MDLRIRIRIHTKMSWIRNTGGSEMFIPDPNFTIPDPGSGVKKKIPDPRIRDPDPPERTEVFLTQNIVSKLSEI
jgi:hypothetical protein